MYITIDITPVIDRISTKIIEFIFLTLNYKNEISFGYLLNEFK